jgi:amino acid transporter
MDTILLGLFSVSSLVLVIVLNYIYSEIEYTKVFYVKHSPKKMRIASFIAVICFLIIVFTIYQLRRNNDTEKISGINTETTNK